ncbi:hypothetical protein VTG60DRAFT_6601 [Thermothelomyces hinnuleus]
MSRCGKICGIARNKNDYISQRCRQRRAPFNKGPSFELWGRLFSRRASLQLACHCRGPPYYLPPAQIPPAVSAAFPGSPTGRPAVRGPRWPTSWPSTNTRPDRAASQTVHNSDEIVEPTGQEAAESGAEIGTCRGHPGLLKGPKIAPIGRKPPPPCEENPRPQHHRGTASVSAGKRPMRLNRLTLQNDSSHSHCVLL